MGVLDKFLDIMKLSDDDDDYENDDFFDDDYDDDDYETDRQRKAAFSPSSIEEKMAAVTAMTAMMTTMTIMMRDRQDRLLPELPTSRQEAAKSHLCASPLPEGRHRTWKCA